MHLNRIAIECHESYIIYHELNKLTDRMASVLQASGISVCDIVALHVECSIGMMVAIMAILKSGAAYLPV